VDVFDFHLTCCSFNMGNGQSTPAPRRPSNKLSKPRTNSVGNLTTQKLVSQSFCDSQPNILRYNEASGEATVGEAAGQEDISGTQTRTQGNASQLDSNSTMDNDYFDALDRWSMSNSRAVDAEEDRLVPQHRYNLPTKG
jgi:hypothetical protein